ncbi:hypothetical protein BJ508DRAFT_168434 [Ascobolus immersus RN42]|uniref:Uncharacterized protein n=1 Tax=Ascobolus immersus RN42 TaxID=1160509 RepID=A0A3N4IJN1_ASCIM|nr:hypothetical protein BJ508DRAFT_168434 [Ascobolus immersus RN42]
MASVNPTPPESMSDPVPPLSYRQKTANWTELQERMFGSRLRDNILSCKEDLLVFNDHLPPHDPDPDDNGYDTDFEHQDRDPCGSDGCYEDWYETVEDPEHSEFFCDVHDNENWASRPFVKFCKGNAEYPQRGGEFPLNRLSCRASKELQEALKHLFQGWSGSMIRDTMIAGLLDGPHNTHESPLASWQKFPCVLTQIVEEFFLFLIYVLVPCSYRLLNKRLGRNTETKLGVREKRKQLDASICAIDSKFYSQWSPDQDIWMNFLAREKAGLVREAQVWIIEAYVRSRIWELWWFITAGHDIFRIYSFSSFSNTEQPLFGPALKHFTQFRSERIESLIMRYLDEEDVHEDVAMGLEIAETVIRSKKRDYNSTATRVDIVLGKAREHRVDETTVVDHRDLEYMEKLESEIRRAAFKCENSGVLSSTTDEYIMEINKYGVRIRPTPAPPAPGSSM